MKQYIVYWILSKIISVPCPDRVAKYDEFGRLTNAFQMATSCAVVHYKRVNEQHKKSFDIRDSAMAFYNKAMAEKLDSVRIDSLEVSKWPVLSGSPVPFNTGTGQISSIFSLE